MTDIVRANALRNEDWFPPSLRSFVIIGDDGCGNLIAFDTSCSEAVLWNPADGDWIQERRPTVSELWDFIERLYENEV